MRTIQTTYTDPLDLIWLQAADELGWRVVRDGEVYASFDGESILRIGLPGTLDPDDCLAQMIFHEICHALVEGPAGWSLPDWGLEYGRDEHLVREQATLRLQAALAARFGLRKFLAPTTDYRAYYDRLPDDPVAPGDDPAIAFAQAAVERAQRPPWEPPLRRALTRTAAVAQIVASCAPVDSLWSTASGVDLISRRRDVE